MTKIRKVDLNMKKQEKYETIKKLVEINDMGVIVLPETTGHEKMA